MRIHDSSHYPHSGRPRPEPLPEGATTQEKIIHAIKQVYDPEIPVNVYDLGLIYEVNYNEQTHAVKVIMTLTTPHCPEAQSIPEYVKRMAETVEEVSEAEVEITWNPMWTKDRMSEEAKLILGMM